MNNAMFDPDHAYGLQNLQDVDCGDWQKNLECDDLKFGFLNLNQQQDLQNLVRASDIKKGLQDANDIKGGVKDLISWQNLKGVNTAIVTTPEKATALLNMNSQLAQPYQVKGAFLI